MNFSYGFADFLGYAYQVGIVATIIEI